MLKKLAFTFAAVSLLALSASADTGIFGSFVVLNTGNGSTFYDLGSNTANPDFTSLNGSVFDPAVAGHYTFVLTGAELNTYKNNNGGFNDVGLPQLYYSISSGGATGSFNLPFNSEFPNFGNNPGDQKWQALDQSVNLFAGLTPGTYTATIHIVAPTGNDGNLSGSLDTGNYSVTFTVVPEPSSFALVAGPGLLAAYFLVRRRRA